MGSQCSERTRGETWQCFEDFPLKNFLTKTIYNCIAPVGFLPWEIRVAFPGESQLRQSRSTQPTVHAGCFSVSIIHRTLTWTTGSLTCAQVLMHAFAHGGVRTHRQLTLGEKSLPRRGIEPPSAASRSDALPMSYIPTHYTCSNVLCTCNMGWGMVLRSFRHTFTFTTTC